LLLYVRHGPFHGTFVLARQRAPICAPPPARQREIKRQRHAAVRYGVNLKGTPRTMNAVISDLFLISMTLRDGALASAASKGHF